jgi:hypothetical protein
MSDERLLRELAALRPIEPSPGFVRRVASAATAPPAAPPRRVLAAAALAAALTVCGVSWHLVEVRREERHWDRVAAEAAALERDLEELRGQVADRPLLWLGGDERLDLVLDVDRMTEAGLLPAAWAQPGRQVPPVLTGGGV